MKIGQAIQYEIPNPYYKGYGVIIKKTENDTIFCVNVEKITNYTKCYDELGARYPEDKDNVRLKDCPAPFCELAGGEKMEVYMLWQI